MAFCRNCGSNIPDGVKFCENCGTRVDIGAEDTYKAYEGPDNGDDFDYDIDYESPKKNIKRVAPARQIVAEPVSALDKFGKFYGIALLILALIDFQSDPPFITMVLSLLIIGGAVFCFVKKYKLKGFNIAALILAVICLLCGISQGKKHGMFKIPKDNSYEATENVETTIPSIDVEKDTDEVTENTDSETETVDPDLKAFLDSYEDFMDEYVEFMKKYQADPNNALSMMSDYMKILSKYEEFAKKADSYNQDEMTKEDLAYYIDAMARIEKKMLEAL